FVRSVEGFQNTSTYGYLFQEPIRQHPELQRMSGQTVSTMRMVVALEQGGPRLLRVMFRIARPHSVTDNLVGGLTATLAAAVDISNGRVVRVISGTAAEEREFEVHPDTGATVLGFQIPHWDSCVATVYDAAS